MSHCVWVAITLLDSYFVLAWRWFQSPTLPKDPFTRWENKKISSASFSSVFFCYLFSSHSQDSLMWLAILSKSQSSYNELFSWSPSLHCCARFLLTYVLLCIIKTENWIRFRFLPSARNTSAKKPAVHTRVSSLNSTQLEINTLYDNNDGDEREMISFAESSTCSDDDTGQLIVSLICYRRKRKRRRSD